MAALSSVPRPRSRKRKQMPAPSAKSVTLGQQPQPLSRQVRQRVSRGGAAPGAAGGNVQPKDPAAKPALSPKCSQKPTAAKDQPAAPIADIQLQKKVEHTAKQDAGDDTLPAAGEPGALHAIS